MTQERRGSDSAVAFRPGPIFTDRSRRRRSVQLRLRLVIRNASWETVLEPPSDDRPEFEIAFDDADRSQSPAQPASRPRDKRDADRTRWLRQFFPGPPGPADAGSRRAPSAGMLVLDAGAGRGPYKHLFAHAHYEAADFAQLSTRYAPLDYVCDLSAIPVEDGRFDRIVFNQVLEHVPEPELVSPSCSGC